MVGTPNAEKYVLEADAMRRRQLRSALLHGSTRTWREHRRVWPAVVVGIVLVAVVIAALAVVNAYRKQQELNPPTPTPTPTPTAEGDTSTGSSGSFGGPIDPG